jgi:hypothetical protein
MKQTINHPDELLEQLQERRTEAATGQNMPRYREGYVDALDWAMRVVESFIFARPE